MTTPPAGHPPSFSYMPWPASAPISIRSVPGQTTCPTAHVPSICLWRAPFQCVWGLLLSHLIQDAFQVRKAHAHAVFVEILRQLFVLRHDPKVRRGPTFGVMFGARLRGLRWLCLAGVLFHSCQPAPKHGEADQTGFIHPSHAHGFAWAMSDQGQTTLIIHQPRTGKAIATVSGNETRDGSTLVRTFTHHPRSRPSFVTTSTMCTCLKPVRD